MRSPEVMFHILILGINGTILIIKFDDSSLQWDIRSLYYYLLIPIRNNSVSVDRGFKLGAGIDEKHGVLGGVYHIRAFYRADFRRINDYPRLIEQALNPSRLLL